MKKYQLSLKISDITRLPGGLLHICLVDPAGGTLPEMLPGQFVEVAVDKSKVLLNRPFSIYNATPAMLELLVKPLGRASEALGAYEIGDSLRVIAPLGRGFSSAAAGQRVLLIGGGVGIAPMLYQARALREAGAEVTVLYGERTAPAAEICNRLAEYAAVEICTDDGSMGTRGFVTASAVLLEGSFDLIQVCGPKPMMKAVGAIARERGIPCEVSLENMMACGLGACLCCVEPTFAGNVCVCKDGPVFNLNELPW